MNIPTNDTDRAIDYIEAHYRSDHFLSSLRAYYRIHHTLTPRQVSAVMNIQQERYRRNRRVDNYE